MHILDRKWHRILNYSRLIHDLFPNSYDAQDLIDESRACLPEQPDRIFCLLTSISFEFLFNGCRILWDSRWKGSNFPIVGPKRPTHTLTHMSKYCVGKRRDTIVFQFDKSSFPRRGKNAQICSSCHCPSWRAGKFFFLLSKTDILKTATKCSW